MPFITIKTALSPVTWSTRYIFITTKGMSSCVSD